MMVAETMILSHDNITCREKPTIALLAAVLALSGSAGRAQTYPAKPTTLIVPFAAGGSNDMIARVIGKKLSERWGEPDVIDNRGGAGGVIGSSANGVAAPHHPVKRPRPRP